jgi:hypothetical protein
LVLVMISLQEGGGPRTAKALARVYAVRLLVGALQPRIWRRLLVRETMWLSRLHEASQAAFGWYDYQAHVFSVGERRLGNPGNRGVVVVEDDRDVTLAELNPVESPAFSYDYLFADGWHVNLRVEKCTAAAKGGVYPRCVAGGRAGPPEDCGGVGAYKDMVYCLKHPATDLGREWRQWVGPGYDPEQCDLVAINRALRRLAK